MSIVLDLIIIAIILFFVLSSAKRGFVNAVVETVGIVAAIIISLTISTPLSQATYDKIIEPSIKSVTSLDSIGTVEQVTDTAWEALPSFIKNNSESLGISVDEFNQSIAQNIDNGVEAAAEAAVKKIVEPIALKVLKTVYAVVLAVLLIVAVKFIAKVVNRLFSFSIIGKANRTLGGVIGLFKGTVVALLFCMVVSLIVSFTKNGFLIFTAENINNSYIFKLLADIIPMR